jgi:hypothetical protein
LEPERAAIAAQDRQRALQTIVQALCDVSRTKPHIRFRKIDTGAHVNKAQFFYLLMYDSKKNS